MFKKLGTWIWMGSICLRIGNMADFVNTLLKHWAQKWLEKYWLAKRPLDFQGSKNVQQISLFCVGKWGLEFSWHRVFPQSSTLSKTCKATFRNKNPVGEKSTGKCLIFTAWKFGKNRVSAFVLLWRFISGKMPNSNRENVCIKICFFEERKLRNVITEVIAQGKGKIAPFMR